MRSGGYGIAGWAVAGDVVIDMSLIRDIDIEHPQPTGDGGADYTRLKDMPAPGSKGKARVAPPPSLLRLVAQGTPTVTLSSDLPTSMKRRREEDAEDEAVVPTNVPLLSDTDLRNYDAASHTVAQFLRGPALPLEAGGETPRQPPTNKRRLNSPERTAPTVPHLEMPPPLAGRQPSGESTSSSTHDTSTSGSATSMSRSTSGDTSATSPGLDGNGTPPSRSTTGAKDPFGYMSTPSSSMSIPSTFPVSRPFSGSSRSGVIPPMFSGALLGSSGFFPPNIPLSIGNSPFSMAQQTLNSMTPPRPVHTHAYVTFGAGIRQKEFDIYSSENPLEGVSSVSGSVEDGLVPYHIPT